MQLRFQAKGSAGYEAVVTAAAGLKFIREFGVVRLDGREAYEHNTGTCEAMLHVIEGTGDILTPEVEYTALGGRQTPFAGPPAAVYLPPGTPFTVRARGGPVEVTLTLADASAGGAPIPVRPQDVPSKQVGRDNWARTVTMIAGPEFPSQRLILGETLNPSGNWSGVPAHKHDTFRAGQESIQEEIYYFRVDRPGGWGIERVYDREAGGLDELVVVQDRTVTLKPRGYHTVAAAPGFMLYYSFVLSGPAKPLTPYVDPYQGWIAE